MNAKIAAILAALVLAAASVAACSSAYPNAAPSEGPIISQTAPASTAPAPAMAAGASPPTVIIDGKQRSFDASNPTSTCVKPLTIAWVSGDATKWTGVGKSTTSISAGLDPRAGLAIFMQFDPTDYRVDPVTKPESGSYT